MRLIHLTGLALCLAVIGRTAHAGEEGTRKSRHHSRTSASSSSPAPTPAPEQPAKPPPPAAEELPIEVPPQAPPPARPAHTEATHAPEKHVTPAAAPAPAKHGSLLWLQLSLGGGWMTDDETTDLSPAFRTGLSLEWQPSATLPLSVFADGAFAAYRSNYLVDGFNSTGGLNKVGSAEQRYDAGLGAGYSIALFNGKLELVPRLAFRFTFLENQTNPWNMGGVCPEGIVRWHIASVLALEVSGGYTYNLFFPHAPESAVLGRALSIGTYGAGIRYSLGETHTDIAIAYVGEVLTRENTYRYYDFLGVSFRAQLLGM